jgi:The  BURPS668_1122 family of deaminases
MEKNNQVDCRFCGGIDNFNINNFSNSIKGIPNHKNHSKEARAITIQEYSLYYALSEQLRRENNIYPDPSNPRILISNIAFVNYIGATGIEQKFVSISEPGHLEGIKQFQNYKLILGRDITNFESITTDGYLSSALLACDKLKVKCQFTHKFNVHPRWHDTEFKILEYLATELLGKDNLEIKQLINQQDYVQIHELTNEFEGVLTIFSERRVCESCASVIKLFKKIFPNIRLDVIEGFGDHIDHGATGPDLPKTKAKICKLRRVIALDQVVITPSVFIKDLVPIL